MSRAKLVGQQNQCSTCGCYFARNSGFERHRVGDYGTGPDGSSPDRRCMSLDEMKTANLSLGIDGFWRFSDPRGIRRAWPAKTPGIALPDSKESA